MTDIAEPIVTRNCHGNVDTIIFLQCIGHRQNIGRHPRSNIEGVARYPFSLQAENRGVRHIVDIDEVARFASVLENIDSVSVLDAGGEDRQNARIGIAQRLARAVHVLVTERYGLLTPILLQTKWTSCPCTCLVIPYTELGWIAESSVVATRRSGFVHSGYFTSKSPRAIVSSGRSKG